MWGKPCRWASDRRFTFPDNRMCCGVRIRFWKTLPALTLCHNRGAGYRVQCEISPRRSIGELVALVA